MKVRSMFVGAAALAAVTFAPRIASAQGPCGPNGGSGYSFTLGLGGALSGCFGFTIQELGENAYYPSRQFYWTGVGTTTTLAPSGLAPSNAPTPAGTEIFTDECGSAGGPGFAAFAFCPVDPAHTATGINLSGEFVLGLLVPDLQTNAGNPYWQFSGPAARNAFPAPTGFQSVLYQMTNGVGGPVIPGQFLFAWEDVNTGCLAVNGSLLHSNLTQFSNGDLGNKQILDDPNNCATPGNGGGPSDADYNDSYLLLNINGTPTSVVPEPMTMTLMATGLVGLAGAQIRRRRKNQS